MTETASSSTLTETGNLGSTTSEMGNAVSGDYTETITGTDAYSMSGTGTNTGGCFTETIAGTEAYTLTESGNTGSDTFARTVVATGTYTWSDTGLGSTISSLPGSYGYTLTESADVLGAEFSQSHTGTDRYDLLQDFTDVSNSGSNAPGNMNFLPYGEAFVDPEGWLYAPGSNQPYGYMVTNGDDTYVYMLDRGIWLHIFPTGPGQSGIIDMPNGPPGVVVPLTPAPLSPPLLGPPTGGPDAPEHPILGGPVPVGSTAGPPVTRIAPVVNGGQPGPLQTVANSLGLTNLLNWYRNSPIRPIVQRRHLPNPNHPHGPGSVVYIFGVQFRWGGNPRR